MIKLRTLGVVMMVWGAGIIVLSQAFEVGLFRGLFIAIGVFFMIEGYDNTNASFGPWSSR